MNTFFSSIFSKIITAIMSILCLFNLAPLPSYDLARPAYNPTPVVGEADEIATHNNTPEFVSDENEDKGTVAEPVITDTEETKNEATPNNNVIGDVYQIINDTQKDNGDTVAPAENADEAQKPAEDANTAETPAEEATNNAAQPTDAVVDDNYEVLETIDISATDADDLTMTLYAAPRAKAAPMRAAGFSINAIDDETESRATVRRDVDLEQAQDDGPLSCVAVIEGDGAMEENVYRHFVSVDKFIEATINIMAAEYGLEPDEIDCVVPDGVTDLKEIDMTVAYYALKDCVAGPAGTQLEVTDNARAALNPADMLAYTPTEIVFDENANVTTISEGAFLFCKDLYNIVIPDTVKTIGTSAFAYCTNLESVTLPKGLESIGATAFMHCHSLKNINLPATLRTIGTNAFEACANLDKVVLNDGLTFIGDEAFINMKEGSTIICPTKAVYDLVNSEDIVTRGVTTVTIAE